MGIQVLIDHENSEFCFYNSSSSPSLAFGPVFYVAGNHDVKEVMDDFKDYLLNTSVSVDIRLIEDEELLKHWNDFTEDL